MPGKYDAAFSLRATKDGYLPATKTVPVNEPPAISPRGRCPHRVTNRPSLRTPKPPAWIRFWPNRASVLRAVPHAVPEDLSVVTLRVAGLPRRPPVSDLPYLST